jgi:hypothetical protein
MPACGADNTRCRLYGFQPLNFGKFGSRAEILAVRVPPGAAASKGRWRRSTRFSEGQSSITPLEAHKCILLLGVKRCWWPVQLRKLRRRSSFAGGMCQLGILLLQLLPAEPGPPANHHTLYATGSRSAPRFPLPCTLVASSFPSPLQPRSASAGSPPALDYASFLAMFRSPLFQFVSLPLVQIEPGTPRVLTVF